jgi:hypothetical protein
MGIDVNKVIEVELTKMVVSAFEKHDVKKIVEEQVNKFVKNELPDLITGELKDKYEDIVNEVLQFDDGIFYEETETKVVKTFNDILEAGLNQFIKK